VTIATRGNGAAADAGIGPDVDDGVVPGIRADDDAASVIVVITATSHRIADVPFLLPFPTSCPRK
jgi:hypothetical protein